MLTCIVWTFQEHCHPSALSYNLCNNSPQHYYFTKFRFFSIDAFITLKYAPICGVIVMYTMYMYYNISSKIRFAMGTLCFIYLDSAIDRQLSIACYEKKQKMNSPKFFTDSPIVNHVLMQIYWRIFKCQVKHDWASKIINIWWWRGESILLWKSGSHLYYFSIEAYLSDLKKKIFLFLERKDELACITLGRILQKL